MVGSLISSSAEETEVTDDPEGFEANELSDRFEMPEEQEERRPTDKLGDLESERRHSR